MSLLIIGLVDNFYIYIAMSRNNFDQIKKNHNLVYMSFKIFKSRLVLVKMTFGAAFAMGLSVFTSCETNSISDLEVIDTDMVEPEVITYDNTARAILDNACIECHNVVDPTDGVILDSFEAAAVVAENGRMIARMTDTSNPMPPSGNLPDGVIADIMQWIEDGILEN